MKKLSKEELDIRLIESSKITGYIYTYTGKESQKDKIETFCPNHNYKQLQTREYAFQGRKIKCCNDNSPMTIEKYNEKLKQFTDPNTIIEMIEPFKGGETKVKISCLKHPNKSRIIKITSLFSKQFESACNLCTHEKYNRNFAFTKKEWARRANIVHKNKYDYSKMENAGLDRTIICKQHGEFFQNFHNHVYLANGCPKCVVGQTTSKAEHELNDYFISLGFKEGIDYIRNDRSILDNSKEIDFYFKNLKIGIEYNGNYWHSQKHINDKNYHKNKKINALKNDINLIMIYEHDWKHKHKNEIIKNRLKSILHKETEIYFSRKLKIYSVSYRDVFEFCEKYHIQGPVTSSCNYGLYNNDELVALMTFGKSRFTDHEYELLRYVSKGTVVGGASRLLNHFKKQKTPKSIMSYADLDWSCGNLYKKIGFTEISKTEPSYVWVKGLCNVISRYKCQTISRPPGVSEDENMTSLGYIKIYKCGSIKFEWIKPVDNLL